MAGNQRVGREAAVKALRAFGRATWLDVSESLGDAIGEETDRGTVILMASAVEDVLTAAIRRHKFVKLSADEDARLFGPDAPLGTFSARIKIAHALGILGREQRNMCDLVRDMRNACAHSRRDISFKDKALRDVLFAALAYISDDSFSEGATPGFCKLHMTWLCAWLARYIRTGSEEEASATIQQLVNASLAEARSAAALQKKQRARPSQDRPTSQTAKQPQRQRKPSQG